MDLILYFVLSFFSCRNSCFDRCEDLQEKLLDIFNNLKDKNAQDSHLAGLITVHAIQRRRSRKPDDGNNNEDQDSDVETSQSHNAYYTYKVRANNQDIAVCQKAFLSLYGIKRARLRRIQAHLIEFGKAPTDQRGKHTTNRYKKTPVEVTSLVRAHIKSFEVRQSHYSIRKNPNRFYLPENLSVKKMWKMLLNLYRVNVSYQVYWEIFTNEFNIKFGLPRSDTCAYCDSMINKIAACSDENEKKRLEFEHK